MEKIKHSLRKENIITYIMLVITSFITYSVMWANDLYSDLSIRLCTHSEDPEWVVSLGRCFLSLINILHFKIAPEPIATMTSLLIYCLAITLVVDIFVKKAGLLTYLTASLSIITISVCTRLGYRFQTICFAFAVLFSAAAFWVLAKYNNKRAVVISAIFVALSVGTYQNDIGITLALTCLYIIYLLFTETKFKDILFYMLKMLISIISGFIMWAVVSSICKVVLKVKEEDYFGSARFSIIELFSNLPRTVVETYTVSWNYFNNTLTHKLNGDIFHVSAIPVVSRIIYIIIALAIIGVFAYNCYKIKDVKRIILAIAMLIITPLACNIVLVIVYEVYMQVQMTLNMSFILTSTMLLLAGLDLPNIFKKQVWVKRLTYCLSIIVVGIALYGQFGQVFYDEYAMLEGKRMTDAMATNIYEDLRAFDGFNTTKPVVIYGAPAYNDFFETSDEYKLANEYAQYGYFIPIPYNNMLKCWNGTFEYILGMPLNLGTADDWETVYTKSNLPDVQYPNNGYITFDGDYYIVNVGWKGTPRRR